MHERERFLCGRSRNGLRRQVEQMLKTLLPNRLDGREQRRYRLADASRRLCEQLCSIRYRLVDSAGEFPLSVPIGGERKCQLLRARCPPRIVPLKHLSIWRIQTNRIHNRLEQLGSGQLADERFPFTARCADIS
ncbi:hypothetical protein D3C84_777080 [compost metagenome]